MTVFTLPAAGGGCGNGVRISAPFGGGPRDRYMCTLSKLDFWRLSNRTPHHGVPTPQKAAGCTGAAWNFSPILDRTRRMKKPLYYKGFTIGATGFEPATSWSRTKRSSQAELRPGIWCRHGANAAFATRDGAVCRHGSIPQPGPAAKYLQLTIFAQRLRPVLPSTKVPHRADIDCSGRAVARGRSRVNNGDE